MRLFEFTLLNEGVVNLFNPEQKTAYADEVFNMINNAYAYAGGIKARGLDTPEGMVANAPMWKIGKTAGKINSAILYKDKGGRKLVLVATDGTQEGKVRLKDMLQHEFERGYMEVSKGFESYIMKTFPDLAKKYMWQAQDAVNFMKQHGNHVELIPGKEHHYSRGLSGEIHPKLMIGTAGKTINPKE